MDKRIKILIAKYFDQQLSKEEARDLIAWIEKGNMNVFNEYVMLNFTIDEIEALRQGPDAESWKEIISKIHKSHRVYKLRYWKYIAAAAIIIFILLPFVFKKSNLDLNKAPTINQEFIIPGTDKAILTLENGNQIPLERGRKFSNQNVNSNGEKLRYKTESLSTEKKGLMAYNHLTVPRGGQFFVQLSDGTGVWLNSESKLKYPISFYIIK